MGDEETKPYRKLELQIQAFQPYRHIMDGTWIMLIVVLLLLLVTLAGISCSNICVGGTFVDRISDLPVGVVENLEKEIHEKAHGETNIEDIEEEEAAHQEKLEHHTGEKKGKNIREIIITKLREAVSITQGRERAEDMEEESVPEPSESIASRPRRERPGFKHEYSCALGMGKNHRLRIVASKLGLNDLFYEEARQCYCNWEKGLVQGESMGEAHNWMPLYEHLLKVFKQHMSSNSAYESFINAHYEHLQSTFKQHTSSTSTYDASISTRTPDSSQSKGSWPQILEDMVSKVENWDKVPCLMSAYLGYFNLEFGIDDTPKDLQLPKDGQLIRVDAKEL